MPLLAWYRENRRELEWRQHPLPYYVWVSEIMLQQTRVEAVKPYFSRFVRELPTILDLALCEEERLLKLWEGLGYYNRVRNMRKAARLAVEQYEGKLPADAGMLMCMPGIGSYTAGAIASIAYGLPEPAVDGNVLRVLSRIQADEACIDDASVRKRYENLVRKVLLSSCPPAGEKDEAAVKTPLRGSDDGADAQVHSEGMHPGEFNQALMELGALVCLPNGAPLCGNCPVFEICRSLQEGLTGVIPVRKKKKGRRVEKKTILVIRDSEHVLIRKRPARGLLAGLWALPGVEGHLSLSEALQEAKRLGASPVRIQALPTARHVFTHIEWEMTGYLILAEELDEEKPLHRSEEDPQAGSGCRAVGIRQIEEAYSIPSAYAAYLAWLDIKRKTWTTKEGDL